jgi:hypothetical protein
MEDISQQPAPANPPPTPDAVLAEQLTQCHKAIGACFFTSYSTDYSLMSQLECLNVAERLMRVSIALAAALGKSGREFTHRIIVEHPAPMIDVTPEAAWDPHPPGASRKQPRQENRVK